MGFIITSQSGFEIVTELFVRIEVNYNFEGKYNKIMSENALIAYLEQFVTSERLKKFDEVLQKRTRYLTVVLEDLYQSHNASAILRTCDCFGIQDVHVMENRNRFEISPDVALGASKWLNLCAYPGKDGDPLRVIRALKMKGYRIVATSPHSGGVPLTDFNIEKGKVALLFGTELKGLSNEILDQADEFMLVPMAGFTESMNVSVTAGIVLHHLILKLKTSGIDWKLTEDEKNKVKLEWLRNSIKRSEVIERQFLTNEK
jgi:tRNA (guanosine-2'-O-)-methyltransferase